jgi:transposase InsO family protein
VLRRSIEPGQYTAIRYTDRLTAAGALASVGSTGDSYDKALAESTIGQIKTELIHRRGPWRTVEQLEFALFEYSTGGTTAACTARSACSPQPSRRPPTTVSPVP